MVDRKTKYCNWSHIKDFQYCIDNNLEKEAFDPDNGFYLNRDIDIYFNNGDLTWDDNGIILFADNLSKDEKDKFKNSNSNMNKEFLTPERLVYLEFHQKKIFNQK